MNKIGKIRPFWPTKGMLGVRVFSKQICLVLGLMIGISFPVTAELKNPLLDGEFLKNHKNIARLNETFGLPKSAPREMTEQLLSVLMHSSIELKDDAIVVDLKKGITAARDALYKKATYGLVDKTIKDALEKDIAPADKEAFEKRYKENIKPFVGDGCDIIFRGIKYWNDTTKVQKVSAYLKDDIVPYLIKKKIVWMTQKAARGALERNKYGKWIAGAYDVACVIPIVGTELEELPRTILEFIYDKGLMKSKTLLQKYILPIQLPLPVAIPSIA